MASKREKNKKTNPGQKKIGRKKALGKIGISTLAATSLIFLEAKAGPGDSPMAPARAPRRGR